MTGLTAKSGTTSVVTTGITYKNPTSTTTSTQVYKWTTGGKTYTYTYDARGNITAIADGTYTTSYAYDSLDQLTRENNQAAGKTWVYAYDNGGNILSKTEYAYTTGTLGTALDTITYGYGDTAWKDLLTSYDGQTLTSDTIGNLTNDGTWSYMWQHGRQLAQMHRQADYNADIFYEYDANGKRIVKRYEDVIYYENGSGTLSAIRYPVTTYYSYCSDTLSYILIHDDSSRDSGSYRELYFTYDAVGPLSVNYNGTEYFYLKNAQGDVTGIVNAAGTQVVAYTYDAWGKLLSTTGSMAGTLGEYNPLRYRGYVYDTETGLYYLNSRYYNPETGRFINADSVIDRSKILGANVFSYCLNNPVNMLDEDGNLPKWLSGALTVVSGITQVIAGAALVAASHYTGIGLVVGGALILNGAATVLAGSATIINDLTGSNFSEENIIRTAVRKVGAAIGGETGENIAATMYDVANTAATVYSVVGGGGTALSKTASALGNQVKITKSTFSMVPSMFMDTYRIERAMTATKEYILLPKTWFRITNGIGSLTDITLTVIGVFGRNE